MLVVEKLQISIRSGKNSSLSGIRRSVVDYVNYLVNVGILYHYDYGYETLDG
jgi:hypothetical protein